ncbi:MAG: TolC family protein, partial [bacterium]|nr:TolC family protein [bacterium]
MKVTSKIVFLIVLIFTGHPSYGTDAFTLDRAIESALANNPAYQGALFDEKAAGFRPSQAASLPDPLFMMETTGVPMDSIDVRQGNPIDYMVEQQIPFPSKLIYGYKAEAFEAKAQSSRKDATRDELVRQVTNTYVQLWVINKEKEISANTLQIYGEGKKSAERGYASAKGSVSDPVRASVDMGELEGRIALLEQEELKALARLSALMGNPVGPDIKTEDPPLPTLTKNLDELIQEALTSKPEINEAENEVLAERARLSLAKSQYAPDFSLRWGYMDMPAGQQNTWLGRVGFSLPFWFFSKQNPGVKESGAMVNKARSLKNEATLNTEAEVRSTLAQYNAANKIVEIYQNTVLPRVNLLV